MVDNTFNQNQYSQNADLYLESNVNGDIGGGTPQTRASTLLGYLPKGRKVFEIGSGGGADAIILQKSGYDVIASDFVSEFVQVLKKKGLPAIYFDAKRDEFPEMDALYANGVFVHFTPQEIKNCLLRAKEKLLHEKLVFIAVLKGEGWERSARGRGFERDFYYYNLQSLTEILRDCDFKIVYQDDTYGRWMQIIGQAI